MRVRLLIVPSRFCCEVFHGISKRMSKCQLFLGFLWYSPDCTLFYSPNL